MKLLYHIAENRFIVKRDKDLFLVSVNNKRVAKIDEMTVESILRQGYWQDAENLKLSNETVQMIESIVGEE